MTEIEEVDLLDCLLQSDKVVKAILADLETLPEYKEISSMADDQSWHNRHIKQLAAELKASRITY